MPTVSEALCAFLQARKTPANADLVDRWSIALETQVNVAADAYEIPNMTHWIQTSNKCHACPIPRGDTRVTAIEVGDLGAQQIPKEIFLDALPRKVPTSCTRS